MAFSRSVHIPSQNLSSTTANPSEVIICKGLVRGPARAIITLFRHQVLRVYQSARNLDEVFGE